MRSAIIAGRLNRERIEGYAYPLVLGLLVSFHLVNNWLWVSTNVTLLGWDRLSHLGKSLIYYRLLQRITPVSLFTAMTWQGYRPPLVFLMASLLYRIFGLSTDVALMSNSLYVAILLLAVYGIGKSIYGKAVGLLAALLTSLFPILFALSRTFYVDYALAAFVSLSIYLLLESDDFGDRKFSLLFGLSLGLGMLVKWTFLAFVAGPFIYTLIRSFFFGPQASVPPTWRGELGRLKTTYRHILAHPLLHLAGGFLLTSIWYLPNKERVANLALGGWLFWLSWLLLSLTTYSLSRRPSPRMNLCSALLLGISIAAPWYLPNIGFLRTFLFVAYGGGGLDVEKIDFLNPATYSHYLSLLAREQISPFYFVAFLAASAFLAWHTVRRSTIRGGFGREVKRGEWVLFTWLVVSYLIFTLSFTRSPRYTAPLLPPVALITARGLLMVKNTRTKNLLLSLLVVAGLFQFFVLSYDGLAWLGEEATWHLPVVGEVSLLARGGYIQTPNRGETDSRYWVAPDILQALHEGAKVKGQGVKLGLLVNNAHLNTDILNYLILLKYDGVELWDLARGRRWKPIYPHIFESDFLLLTDGSLEHLCEEAKEAMERLRESPGFFPEVFELSEEYPFPDGETVYLYRKRCHLAGGYNPEDYRGIGEEVDSLAREGDGIIIVPPEQVEVLGRYIEKRLEPYPLPREGASSEEMEKGLEEIVSRPGRIFSVFWDEGGIEEVHLVEGWLNEHGYRAWERWYGRVRLIIYGPSLGKEGVYRPLRARLGDEIILDGYRLIDEEVRSGDIVRLILHWRARGKVGEEYKVFVHLLDEEGRLVAQRDSEPVGGRRRDSG